MPIPEPEVARVIVDKTNPHISKLLEAMTETLAYVSGAPDVVDETVR